MPTASVGAPPAREMMDCSPTSLAICVNVSGVIAKPQPLTTCAADATTSVVPAGASTAIGLFIAK